MERKGKIKNKREKRVLGPWEGKGILKLGMEVEGLEGREMRSFAGVVLGNVQKGRV